MADKCALRGMEEILNDVISELPGLDHGHAKNVLHQVTNKFLHRTSAWRETVHPIVHAHNGQLTFSAPHNDARVVWYRNLIYQGFEVLRHTEPRIIGAHALIRFIPLSPTSVSIVPVPENLDRDDITVQVILKLAPKKLNLPGELIDTYDDAFREGMLGKLMLEPNKPYSDGSMGLWHSKAFNSAMAEARDTAERGFGRNESLWRYPRWT